MRKPAFCICENKGADQLRGYRGKLISAFVFATRIVQSLYFLNPIFRASSHLLWLYSLVCVGPGRKPQRPVFSERGSYSLHILHLVTCNNVYAIELHLTKKEKRISQKQDLLLPLIYFIIKLMSSILSQD